MRFADMMGSGDEGAPKPPATSESEGVIADALAPYVDRVKPQEPAPQEPAPQEPAPELARAEPARTEPPRPEPLAGSEAIERSEPPVAPERPPLSVPRMPEYAPLSDDLLPRRR
jgi:hypothetical protein